MATPDPNRRPERSPLSLREIRFCCLYAERGKRHGYECWVEAGYEPRETRAASDQAVRRLVKKRQIQDKIRHLRAVAAEAAQVTVSEIVAGIAAIAKADRRKLFDARGKMLPADQWPEDLAAAVDIEVVEHVEPIRGLKGVTGTRVKGRKFRVRTMDRLAAWAKLAEIKGLTGAKKDEPPPEGKKNAVVVEVELGPDKVEPPPEGA